MRRRTLSALRRAIAHWERLRDGRERPWEKPDTNSCALCRRFFNAGTCRRQTLAWQGWEREDCPVYERTGATQCRLTPYARAKNAYFRGQYSPRTETDDEEIRTIIDQEVRFLRSLVPEGEE